VEIRERQSGMVTELPFADAVETLTQMATAL